MTNVNRLDKDSLPPLSYNSLLQDIDTHIIDKIYFTPNLDTVISQYTYNNNDAFLATKITPFVADSVAKLSTEKKIETVFLVEPTPPFFLNNLISFGSNYLIPFIFLSSILSFMRNRLGATGGMPPMLPGFFQRKKMGQDKLLVTKANITLASFAGSEEIMEECTEVISYLKNSTLYDLAGAEIPRGILLEGAPGTGKTLLAKAIASEAEANFISIAASEFVEIFVGVGAAKIRDLFKTARENKPCIVFIDEIDAVGRQRGSSINAGGNDEREQTLNQLLAEMDGFQDNDQVLIMAATNRKDILDTALLRPGRFDRIITVPLPDKSSRQKILESYAQSKHLADDVRLDSVAEITGGFSGAQLKNLMNEAAILAARRGETVIINEYILSALDKLVVGIERNKDDRDDEAKRRVAIHEAGHAFLVNLFQDYFELKKVTIKSTYNGAGGYTLFQEKPSMAESGLYTKDFLIKRLIVAMGGKAAETVFFGEKQVSLGAIQDLKQANSLAQRMIGNYGMGKRLDVFFNEDLGETYTSGRKYSEKTKEKFDGESLQLVKDAYVEALQILSENKDKVECVVDLLLKKTTLNGNDFLPNP